MADVLPSSNYPDLVDAITEVLRQSEEPLTIPQLRERLRGPYRSMRITELLTEVLARQVAANVLVMCPKYRSSQDRFWDRSLRQHAKAMLTGALEAGPMSWTEIRKKLPKYLRHLAESVLDEELAKGAIFRHPPTSSRNGPRYALQPADVRCYAGKELHDLLTRMHERGFARAEVCEALMQLLQENEWSDAEASVGVLT